ncbi:uncharacterized protein E6C27_scaffold675G00250 [Cucumis melo var. makuwa]|uniref:Uncharacterized protein n=1 Tax=Cucumis melo var. makuwa TaxID=1194695 RepID=A0A5A7U792_CUCMM|nr:uncharacterized protein E6C27_scaffold675G00250 [Cucumis melo var. makuwa]
MSSNNYALPSLLLLLLFFFLSNQAQGIRLGNGIMIKLVGQPAKTLEEEVVEGFRKTTICENGHCNSGNNRKLMTVTTPPIPSSPTPSTRNNEEENYKKGNPKSSNKEESSSVKKKDDLENSEAVSKNLEAALDLIDIAEMDYSPAKRKPPIHN